HTVLCREGNDDARNRSCADPQRGTGGEYRYHRDRGDAVPGNANCNTQVDAELHQLPAAQTQRHYPNEHLHNEDGKNGGLDAEDVFLLRRDKRNEISAADVSRGDDQEHGEQSAQRLEDDRQSLRNIMLLGGFYIRWHTFSSVRACVMRSKG